MIATLNYLEAELRLKLSTLCKHLRNKAYAAGSDVHQSALGMVIYYELVADELTLILGHYRNLTKGLEQYLKGEEYNPFAEDEGETIYEYSKAYFERVDCPLGSATDDLKNWVTLYADRQKIDREGFEQIFPNMSFMFSETDAEGNETLRPVTEAERFNSRAEGFLRDIETSNTLDTFNERMRQVYKLLKQEASIADVLLLLKDSDSRD